LVSKAFTKEDDDAPEVPTRRRGVPVPQDVPNYITAAGERTLRAELVACRDDVRIAELTDHLASAVIMEPPADRTKVGFGARVTVEDEHGTRTSYRIVGAIEASPKEGAIYFQTPIAERLYDAQVGDSVTLPRGEVEVIAIEY
jgi:transcription elongation GreA/GreB family factor